jgi:hypothetical protein
VGSWEQFVVSMFSKRNLGTFKPKGKNKKVHLLNKLPSLSELHRYIIAWKPRDLLLEADSLDRSGGK